MYAIRSRISSSVSTSSSPVGIAEIFDVRTDLDDNSRRQLARRKGPRRQELIGPSDHQQIDEINADGMDVDQDLIRSRLRA